MLIYLYAILIGLFAYVFVNVLTQPNEIFGFYGKWLNKIQNDYIRKPLGGCEACFAGQVSLWYSIFYFDLPFFEIPFFVSLSILTANYIYSKL